MRAPFVAVALLAVACNGREAAVESPQTCTTPDDAGITTSADEGVRDTAGPEGDTTPAPAADAATDAATDAAEETIASCVASLSFTADPMQSRCGADDCDVIVWLDDGTHAILGWRDRCEGPRASPLRLVDAERVARGYLALDAPLDTMTAGALFAFHRAPTGAPARGDGGIGFDAGGIVLVDPTLGVPLLVASIDTTPAGGGLLFPNPIDWKPRPPEPLSKSCAPLAVPPATAIAAADVPPTDPKLADAIVTAAWRNPIGWYWERRYGGDATKFTASVLRYAPTAGGTVRDDFVVVKLGVLGCPP